MAQLALSGFWLCVCLSLSLQYAGILTVIVILEIVGGILAFVFSGAVVSGIQLKCQSQRSLQKEREGGGGGGRESERERERGEGREWIELKLVSVATLQGHKHCLSPDGNWI